MERRTSTYQAAFNISQSSLNRQQSRIANLSTDDKLGTRKQGHRETDNIEPNPQCNKDKVPVDN